MCSPSTSAAGAPSGTPLLYSAGDGGAISCSRAVKLRSRRARSRARERLQPIPPTIVSAHAGVNWARKWKTSDRPLLASFLFRTIADFRSTFQSDVPIECGAHDATSPLFWYHRIDSIIQSCFNAENLVTSVRFRDRTRYSLTQFSYSPEVSFAPSA
jgi:hypothetical protein